MSYESINQHPDPRCTRARQEWMASISAVGDKWQYTANYADKGAVMCWHPFSNADLSGKVLYARITSDVQAAIDQLAVEHATTIAKADTWIAARVADGNMGNHSINLVPGTIVLQEVGVYTPDDWEHLYALWQAGRISIPWCAGPRNAAAGVLGPWEV